MIEKVSSEDRKKTQPQPLSRRLKILTTAAILFGNITFVSLRSLIIGKLQSQFLCYGVGMLLECILTSFGSYEIEIPNDN